MEYKAIPGFPGYKVSESGTVIGPDGNKLSPRKDDDGYMRVDLRLKGKRFTRFVHTLVASAFNGRTVKEVDHKNNNRKDNSVSNLEPVTRKENMKRLSERYQKKNKK